MGGPGSGRRIKGNAITSKRKISNPRELRKEIFLRISLNAPWIFSPLEQSSINDLHLAIDGIIERYLNR